MDSAIGTVGLGLLRLSPFAISTTLLINRTAQYYALSSFLPPYIPAGANVGPTFQMWFRTASSRIWKSAIGLTILLRLACIANLIVRPEGRLTRPLYGLCLAGAFAHLPVAPRMLVFERKMKSEESSPSESLQGLYDWLSINNVRLLVVDVPLWLATGAALVEAAFFH